MLTSHHCGKPLCFATINMARGNRWIYEYMALNAVQWKFKIMEYAINKSSRNCYHFFFITFNPFCCKPFKIFKILIMNSCVWIVSLFTNLIYKFLKTRLGRLWRDIARKKSVLDAPPSVLEHLNYWHNRCHLLLNAIGQTIKAHHIRFEQARGWMHRERLFADKGYRGHAIKLGTSNMPRVFLSGQKQGVNTTKIKKELKRRSAIEPVIGHMKENGCLGRNYLKGRVGHQVNCGMAATDFNFKAILRC